MADDLFRRDFKSTQPPRGARGERGKKNRDSLFGWTILILLLIGLAMACWLGTFYVFKHPELAMPYKILKKLKKIDPPKRFKITNAPTGEFLDAQKLYQRYAGMTQLQLANANAELLRHYIRNYDRTNKLVPYLTGHFKLLEAYELNSRNLFSKGMVALMQSDDYPRVVVESVYPAAQENIPFLKKLLVPGLQIKLQKTYDLDAVIHVDRLQDGRMKLTVIPLLYGSYTLKDGSGGFSLEPPGTLNVADNLPLLDHQQTAKAFTAAQFVHRENAQPAIAIPGTAVATPTPAKAELVRSNKELMPSSAPIARAEPVHPLTPQKPGSPLANSPTVGKVAENSVPETPKKPVTETPVAPRAQPVNPVNQTTAIAKPEQPAIPRAQPVNVAMTQPTSAKPGAPLQPFLVSSAASANQNNKQNWHVYRPGQMPRGRLLDPAQAAGLAEHRDSGQRFYLEGDFTVTAANANRATLRARGSLKNRLLRFTHSSRPPRIIVEYPAGSRPPGQGANISRGKMRPFQIMSVGRGANGETNIYVREVTTGGN